MLALERRLPGELKTAAAVAFLAGPAVVSCGRPPVTGGARVEYAGCASVRRGPVCVAPKDGRITVWVPGAGPALPSFSGAGPGARPFVWRSRYSTYSAPTWPVAITSAIASRVGP